MAFVHPEDLDKLKELKDREIGRILEHTNEYRIIRPSGEVRTIREVAINIIPEDGATICHAGTVQDITEQARAEEWLRHAEQTEALAGLAGSIAHEINNMLTPIMLLTSHTMTCLPKGGRNIAIWRSCGIRPNAPAGSSREC
jgi:PAS domain-containing protein